MIRGSRRCLILGALLLILLITLPILRFYNEDEAAWPLSATDLFADLTTESKAQKEQGVRWFPEAPLVNPNHEDLEKELGVAEKYRKIYSVSTPNGTYFPILFDGFPAANPNIIPHPNLTDTWIIVAWYSSDKAFSSMRWNTELACLAHFKNNALRCINAPTILPIAATFGDKCEGTLFPLSANIGPHDARVFYGPDHPWVIYGSNSQFSCFGQWIQDFRLLFDWPWELFKVPDYKLGAAHELQRPLPYGLIEKNWFAFWDDGGSMYLHYDISPSRSFAKVESDGSVGLDLAAGAKLTDEHCMARFMPELVPDPTPLRPEDLSQSTHQATNSLKITLCKRADPTCFPSPSNTFILTIFHAKKFHNWHSEYDPYVMLFQAQAPFAVHAISTKPLWIHGRGRLGDRTDLMDEFQSGNVKAHNHTELFYVTSIAWRERGMKWHGFVDDVVFLGFGIEDTATGGIDVDAGQLLQDLGLCFGS